jgi:hypothetical protein
MLHLHLMLEHPGIGGTELLEELQNRFGTGNEVKVDTTYWVDEHGVLEDRSGYILEYMHDRSSAVKAPGRKDWTRFHPEGLPNYMQAAAFDGWCKLTNGKKRRVKFEFRVRPRA